MPPGRYLLYTFLGIWPWAFAMAAIGAFAGVYAKAAAEWFPWVAYVLAIPPAVRIVRAVRRRSQATTFTD